MCQGHRLSVVRPIAFTSQLQVLRANRAARSRNRSSRSGGRAARRPAFTLSNIAARPYFTAMRGDSAGQATVAIMS
jgi:hypothetical protein